MTRTSSLGWLRMGLFALPAAPHAFVIMPLMVVLPSFYAANTQITAAEVALIVTLGRIFDAGIDPFLGYLSDRTHSSLGPRKPWLIGAALICPLAIYYLYQPAPASGAMYFLGWSFLLYVGTSFFEIARSAWMAELTRDYQERSRVTMLTAVCNISGSLSFWMLPLLLSKVTGTTAITSETLSTLASIYLWLMPALLLLTVWVIPMGVPQISQLALSGWRSMLLSLQRCKPLWHFLAAIGCWALGQGTFMAVLYIFMTDYMQLGPQFPIMMMTYFVIQLATMPVWSRVLNHVDRHRAWAAGLGVDACVRLLLVFLPVGPEAFWPALVITIVSAVAAAPCNFLPTAMLADVIDYNTLKTQSNQAARFYAFNSLAIKIMQALGGGLAFSCLAWSNFQIGKPNPPETSWGLMLAYIAIPCALLMAAAVLAWRFPLNRQSQATVKRRLERLATRHC